MRSTAILAATLAIFATTSISRADVPPPPDMYNGPWSATVAGLQFQRQNVQHYISERAPNGMAFPHGSDIYVLLTGCDSGTKNCGRAQKAGAIGGAIVRIDGNDVDSDVQALEDALRKPGNHTLMLLSAADTVEVPLQPNLITLSVSVP